VSGGNEATQHGSGSGSGNGDAGGENATTEGAADVNPAVPDLGIVLRDPNFIKYPIWQDLNRDIDSELGPPPLR
jgi:hypothetical protein